MGFQEERVFGAVIEKKRHLLQAVASRRTALDENVQSPLHLRQQICLTMARVDQRRALQHERELGRTFS